MPRGLSQAATLYMGGGGAGAAAPAASGWNLSGAVYDTKNILFNAHETTAEGMFFKPDGTKVYIVGTDEDRLIQYDLSTAWDVSTASYVTKTDISFLGPAPSSVWFKPDGTKAYILQWASGARIYQYSLGTAWDISTISSDGVYGTFTASGSDQPDMYFNSDGTKVYTLSVNNKTIYQHSLSTAWSITSISYDSKSYVVPNDTAVRGFFLKYDGTKLYTTGVANDRVYQYTLSTAGDISTATYDSVSFSVLTQEGAIRSVFWKPDGAKMYILGSGADRLYQYTTT